MPSLHFNVQSALFSLPFWTSAYLSSASTSNLPRLLISFGLSHDFPLLQCPICHACSSLLDFLMPFLRFNVQSATLACPFWTFSCLFSASTSNLPCFLFPFGLQHTFPPLQRPICRACSSLLDFLMTSLCFNVQSATLARPFWTFSCLFSASTSNLPRLLVPFGLSHAFSPLQRPIHRACQFLLDFLMPFLCFNVQSAAIAPLIRLPSGP